MRKSTIVLFLVGASLAAVLTLGVVPAVTALYAAHHRFAEAVEPWIIDLGSFVANAALLFALLRLRRRVGDSAAREEDIA